MAALRREGAPWPGAVGVSGGGDSLSLLVLLAEWAKANGLDAPSVLTVDHRLRKESGNDAKAVFAFARALGLKASILRLIAPPAKSDIEAWARQARYAAMAKASRKQGLAALYVGHNQDDQAETFMLRLARGSGLDGLSGMLKIAAYPLPDHPDLRLVRPLLDFSRAEVRTFLRTRGFEWRDDPMNADPRFARVRMRAAWPAFEAAGLSAARVAAAATHLRRSRDFLDTATADFLERYTQLSGARLLIDGAAFASLPRELGLRALAKILMDISERAYRPRFERLEACYDALLDDELTAARTLHGCRLSAAPKRQAIYGAGTLLAQREAPRRAPAT